MTRVSEKEERGARRFDANYGEDAVLADGTRVHLRLVRATDRTLLAEGFARLSPTSRLLRFLGAKTALSDDELTYLTDLDGENHFALGALIEESDGHTRGVGVARFVRDMARPEAAEPAVAVVDDMQGKGLGRLLLERLAAAAIERGVRVFHFDVLALNRPMLSLLDRFADAAREEPDGDVIHVEIPLEAHFPGAPAQPPSAAPIYRALSLAARGAFELRRLLRRGD